MELWGGFTASAWFNALASAHLRSIEQWGDVGTLDFGWNGPFDNAGAILYVNGNEHSGTKLGVNYLDLYGDFMDSPIQRIGSLDNKLVYNPNIDGDGESLDGFGFCRGTPDLEEAYISNLGNLTSNITLSSAFRDSGIKKLHLGLVRFTSASAFMLNSTAIEEIIADDFKAGSGTATLSLSTKPNLHTLILGGFNANLDISNGNLNGAALNALFESVADLTGETTRTLTVTGNPGIIDAEYDATIATAKNWTVTE